MRIKDLFENKWDDFGRTEFPDEYFADIDQNHPWMKNDHTRFTDNNRALSSFETGSFSRSPYDFIGDLFEFSTEQLKMILQVHGIMPTIDITAPGAKMDLIKLAVRNQSRIAQSVSSALRKKTRQT